MFGVIKENTKLPMQQTFTFNTDIHTKLQNETPLLCFENSDFINKEPSELSIQNILNFSRNLEVKKSEKIGVFDYLKS